MIVTIFRSRLNPDGRTSRLTRGAPLLPDAHRPRKIIALV